MTPEEIRKLKEAELARQKQLMDPNYTEPGIQEESELSITNLPKKAAISKLRESGMPVAAEIADIGIPELDVTNVAGKVKRAGSAVSRIANKEDEASQVWNKLVQLFKGQSTENLEKLRKLPLPDQKAVLRGISDRVKQIQSESTPIAGKIPVKSNPSEGPALDYSKMNKPEPPKDWATFKSNIKKR